MRFSLMSRRHVTAPLSALLVTAILILSLLPQTARAQGNSTENPFPGRFPAPSLDGGVEWLNTSGPIDLRDLRGKIVLLDFWTYCCINCIHILPDLKMLEQKYKDQLVVIGVHSAKFENERDSDNIREAIMRYEIEHPVVNDANMIIARKYLFNTWPTLILIDPEGNFVGRQHGEGHGELLDKVIGQMVAFHRRKGTLDETPVTFQLERASREPTPLDYPGKILVDEQGGRVFISDSNHNRIVVASLEGELLHTIGSGQIGAADGSFTEATFDHPQGMALVDEVLYVADTENHLIRTVDLKAETVSTLAGTGEQSRARAIRGPLRTTALNSPWDLVHVDGWIYIAMAGPHQIWRHEIGSNRVELYAGTGREDILDGPIKDSALAQPSAIVTDGNFLFVADSEGSAIRQIGIPPRSRVITIVGPHDMPQGASLFAFGDQDGVGDVVRLQHPIGLAYHDQKLYIADTYNDKIKIVDIPTRETRTWLGTGTAGTSLAPVELYEPAGLAVTDQFLFIADTNNHRILKTNLSTKETTEFVVNGLTPPDLETSSPGDTFFGKTVDVAGATVAAGQPLSVKIDFQLPVLHKLNELAPVIYELSVADSKGLVDAEALAKRHEATAGEMSASFEIPLTGQTGTADLTVTLSYQYCRDGSSGLCRFGSQRWKIPVTIAAQGTSELELTANPGGL